MAQILLYQGRADRAWLAAESEDHYEMTGWEDNRARCRLYRAEAASRMDGRASLQEAFDKAARWVLHSGSMEHLCLYHLVRARIARRAGDLDVAQLAVDEGLRVARQCGFWLYQVELLCEQAERQLAGSCDTGAVRSAREAFELASSPDCQFLWGAAEAGHLLGRASSPAAASPTPARRSRKPWRSGSASATTLGRSRPRRCSGRCRAEP